MENQFVYPLQKRTWAEISIPNIIHNYNAVKSKIGPDTKICCVIKANAYGHGAVRLAQEYSCAGADFFAVANIDEAMQLRENGVKLPILILGYTDPRCAGMLGNNDIVQCVFSYTYALKLNEYAKKENVCVKIHLKLDTGMGRLGFLCTDADLKEAAKVANMEHLKIKGVFTHLSFADEGKSGSEYTRMQIEKFNASVAYLESLGIRFELKHCSNSAGAFDYPEASFDMVRCGIALYGCQSDKMINKCDLKPAMTLKTIISFIKTIPEGALISYGGKFKANSAAKIATLPIGYADGLWRSNFSNSLEVCVKGHYVPIVGKICMDQCMIDISGLDDINVGDEVVIFGEESGHTVDDVARLNNTISYEILCSVGMRVPRIYKTKN